MKFLNFENVSFLFPLAIIFPLKETTLGKNLYTWHDSNLSRNGYTFFSSSLRKEHSHLFPDIGTLSFLSIGRNETYWQDNYLGHFLYDHRKSDIRYLTLIRNKKSCKIFLNDFPDCKKSTIQTTARLIVQKFSHFIFLFKNHP